MKLSQIRGILEAEVLCGENYLDREITSGCGSDLMSDVLAFGQLDTILLTGLATAQVIYTAEMASIGAICFVRGKKPREEAIRLARERGIVLLTTRLFLYNSCGRLFCEGLRGQVEGAE